MNITLHTPFSRVYCIYKHTNIVNHKIYIGQTCLPPEGRWSNGNGYKSQPAFYQDILKYGWLSNFTHEILEDGLDEEQVNIRERYWIAYYHSNDPAFGYNLTSGGSSHSIRSEEANKKTSESLKKFYQTDTGKALTARLAQQKRGKNNGMYGRHHSDLVKEAQSQRMMGGKNPNFQKIGIKNHLAKPVYCIELNCFYGSGQEAARITGADASSIAKVCKGFQNTAKKYHWRYATDEEVLRLKEGEKHE